MEAMRSYGNIFILNPYFRKNGFVRENLRRPKLFKPNLLRPKYLKLELFKPKVFKPKVLKLKVFTFSFWLMACTPIIARLNAINAATVIQCCHIQNKNRRYPHFRTNLMRLLIFQLNFPTFDLKSFNLRCFGLRRFGLRSFFGEVSVCEVNCKKFGLMSSIHTSIHNLYSFSIRKAIMV